MLTLLSLPIMALYSMGEMSEDWPYGILVTTMGNLGTDSDQVSSYSKKDIGKPMIHAASCVYPLSPSSPPFSVYG